VAARVNAGPGRSFVQRFVLSRTDSESEWKIDAISQEGVSAENVLSAFTAAPDGTRLPEALRQSRRLAP